MGSPLPAMGTQRPRGARLPTPPHTRTPAYARAPDPRPYTHPRTHTQRAYLRDSEHSFVVQKFTSIRSFGGFPAWRKSAMIAEVAENPTQRHIAPRRRIVDRYQITCSVVLIGSKITGAQPACTPAQAADALAQAATHGLVQREFASGNAGFFLSAKVAV